jgi:hypothetical protein
MLFQRLDIGQARPIAQVDTRYILTLASKSMNWFGWGGGWIKVSAGQ